MSIKSQIRQKLLASSRPKRKQGSEKPTVSAMTIRKGKEVNADIIIKAIWVVVDEETKQEELKRIKSYLR
jgi:hypothetical protein